MSPSPTQDASTFADDARSFIGGAGDAAPASAEVIVHEAGHAILDSEQDFVVSLIQEQSHLSEVRANAFAGHYLLPPEFVRAMPTVQWNDVSIVAEATRLRVNVATLVIALQREGRISEATAGQLLELKIPRAEKMDPELPPSLSAAGRALKIELLRRGLSTHYARLCFDAYDRGLTSWARLAEMLLSDERALSEIGSLYGWSQKHA